MNTTPDTLTACRQSLLASDEEIRDAYPYAVAERVIRLKDVYNCWLANPSMKDRDLRDYIRGKYDVSLSAAYDDIKLVHQLAPLVSSKSRDFHRLRTNEMLLETYAKAQLRGDVRTMERVANTYGKINNVDVEDEHDLPYDKIVPQPFFPTVDPQITLGLKPIPNVYDRIAELTAELSRDLTDIEDVEYEEADLPESYLFPESVPGSDDNS